jgi:uncharacterized membrane protein YidH (DUF202 family)
VQPDRPPFLQSLGVVFVALGTVVAALAAVGLMALFSRQMLQGDPRAAQCAWLIGGGVAFVVIGVLMKRFAARKPA